LESQIKELIERLQALKARLNQNSRNSSKPPSTDFSVKEKPNPKSRRKKSEKRPGGQEGHTGTTLDMVVRQEAVSEIANQSAPFPFGVSPLWHAFLATGGCEAHRTM